MQTNGQRVLIIKAPVNPSAQSNVDKHATDYLPATNVTKSLNFAGVKILMDLMPPWYDVYRKELTFDKCPQHRNCLLTKNITLLEKSSAFIANDKVLRDIPEIPSKLTKQVWIFHTDESPNNIS